MISNSSLAPLYYTRLIGPVNEKSVVEVIKDVDQANGNEAKKDIVLTLCSSGGLLSYAQARKYFGAVEAKKLRFIDEISEEWIGSY